MTRRYLNRVVLVIGSVVLAMRVVFPPKVVISNGNRLPDSAVGPEAFHRMATVDVALLALHVVVIAALTAAAWWFTRLGEESA